MKEEIRYPKCGSDKVDSFKHSGAGPSNNGKLPNAKGLVTYECLNPKCRHIFSEDNLNKNN